MDCYADFSGEPVVAIYPKQIEEIKKKAEKNSVRKRYRICAHSSPNDELHEMYICAKDEGYIPPCMHPDTAETHFILKGSLATVLFNDVGDITDVVVLDKEQGALSCRVGKNIYHMDFFISEWATFLEFKRGPFTKESNLTASWAPNIDDKLKAEVFMNNVRVAVQKECARLNISLDFTPPRNLYHNFTQ